MMMMRMLTSVIAPAALSYRITARDCRQSLIGQTCCVGGKDKDLFCGVNSRSCYRLPDVGAELTEC